MDAPLRTKYVVPNRRLLQATPSGGPIFASGTLREKPDLPNEILLMIVEWLPPIARAHLSATCWAWLVIVGVDMYRFPQQVALTKEQMLECVMRIKLGRMIGEVYTDDAESRGFDPWTNANNRMERAERRLDAMTYQQLLALNWDVGPLYR